MMGVYIKNMEMPKGESCVTVRIWGDGRVVGVHNDSFVKQAISVPTPHGDLIDEVIRELGLNCCYEMPSFWTNNRKDYKVIATKYHKGYLQALEDVEKAVKQRVGWLESESEGE